jgi:hypothetical protein
MKPIQKLEKDQGYNLVDTFNQIIDRLNSLTGEEKIPCDCPKGGVYETEDGGEILCEKCGGSEWKTKEENIIDKLEKGNEIYKEGTKEWIIWELIKIFRYTSASKETMEICLAKKLDYLLSVSNVKEAKARLEGQISGLQQALVAVKCSFNLSPDLENKILEINQQLTNLK